MSSFDRVVVTGASSMLGVCLIEALIQSGISAIFAIVRPRCTKVDRIPRNTAIHIVECDICNYSTLPSKINVCCSHFYHLAWQSNGTSKDRNSDIRSQSLNIVYSIDALKAAKALGCSTFVGVGSQAEYGLLEVSRIKPDNPCNPIQPYGIAKYAAGKLLLAESENLNMSCAWVRAFSIYGPRDRRSSLISTLIIKLISGETPELTPGEQIWDYLYEKDAGEALALIGKYVIGTKVYCLGSGHTQTIAEYAREVNRQANPDLHIKVGALPYPKNVVMNICADITSLTNDTGWKPTTNFQQGIADTIAFWKEGIYRARHNQ